MNKKVVVVSGPSGVGKTTLCELLFKKERRLMPCVTATTRPKRPGEVNGRDYYFISKPEFRDGIKTGRFAEYIRVFGNYYGTPFSSLEAVFSKKRYPLLRIDVKGASRLKKRGFKGIYIFILPPDATALRQRLAKRREKDCARRLKRFTMELRYRNQYDFQVINDNLNRAVGEIRSILKKNLYDVNA